MVNRQSFVDTTTFSLIKLKNSYGSWSKLFILIWGHVKLYLLWVILYGRCNCDQTETICKTLWTPMFCTSFGFIWDFDDITFNSSHILFSIHYILFKINAHIPIARTMRWSTGLAITYTLKPTYQNPLTLSEWRSTWPIFQKRMFFWCSMSQTS